MGGDGCNPYQGEGWPEPVSRWQFDVDDPMVISAVQYSDIAREVK